MQIQIVETEFKVTIIGFSGIVINKDYAGTAFRLMDKMWKIVKAGGIMHKGLNIWVYGPGDELFAGVEPIDPVPPYTGLEQTTLILKKYAYYKHIGPYQLIGKAGEMMRSEIKRSALNIMQPYIEIYGHWTNDEQTLETELLMGVE